LAFKFGVQFPKGDLEHNHTPFSLLCDQSTRGDCADIDTGVSNRRADGSI